MAQVILNVSYYIKCKKIESKTLFAQGDTKLAESICTRIISIESRYAQLKYGVQCVVLFRCKDIYL